MTAEPLVEPTSDQQRRLVELLNTIVPIPGRVITPWPAMSCVRLTSPTQFEPAVFSPALCVVGQGAKEVRLGDKTYRYHPLNYLVTGASLPVQARVVEASPDAPLLSLVLDLATTDVCEVLADVEGDLSISPSRWQGLPPLRVSPIDRRFLDAVIRFLTAVVDPLDRRVLAASGLREIIYLALRREQGDLIRLAADRDGRSLGVARALRHVHRYRFRPINVAALTRAAGMSASSLHEAFKRATTLSPMQYVKRLRLEHAKQLMLHEGCYVAEAAHRVGYTSASQFSRDFKQFFGRSPREYVER